MPTHTYSTADKSSVSVAQTVATATDKPATGYAFTDERPATITQRKLQHTIDQSLRVKPAAVLQKNTTGLPDQLKAGVESLSGIDISDTRVHYNSPQPAQVQAHAYAQGTDIHIAPGQEKHLPHEAWHVVQQKQGRVQATRQNKGAPAINDDPTLEREADHMGAKAIQLQLADYSQTVPFAQVATGAGSVMQKMSVAQGQTVINTVKAAVPKAGNRLFDIVTTLGDSVNRNAFKQSVLTSIDGLHPFGTANLNDIVPRAQVAKVVNAGVCDNYQEMVIAELDRSGFGAGESVHPEAYPGHSYVSVQDPHHPADRTQDIIVDAWRNMVDTRGSFRFFSKYSDVHQYTQYGAVAMPGTTDWLAPNAAGEHWVRGFLTIAGAPDTGNLANDMNTYIEAHPGSISLREMYPI